MRYLLLIYTAEATGGADDQPGSELAAYDEFTAWLRDKNALEAGEALQPTSTATTVRVRDERTLTTDGPYAETREQLGGFYMVNASDIDEAIVMASRIPGAKHGSIEVRPIWDLPSMGSSSEAVAAVG